MEKIKRMSMFLIGILVAIFVMITYTIVGMIDILISDEEVGQGPLTKAFMKNRLDNGGSNWIKYWSET